MNKPVNVWLPRLSAACAALLACGGCPSDSTSERNPYLTFIEAYGSILSPTTAVTTGGVTQVGGTTRPFRQTLTLTFSNEHRTALVDTSFVAWVYTSSVRTGEQQDALLKAGYVQLTRPLEIGTAYTLPLGTFVYNGPGTAGATPVRILPGQGAESQVTPTTVTYSLLTPDVILVFSEPPVSCDSVAFAFRDVVTGDVLDGPTTAQVGYKTLAQVDVYQCQPFRPGLFFNSVSGQLGANQYDEGQTITILFREIPVNGAFASVTIGTPTESQTGSQTGRSP
jgi:hypothetical protein